MKKIPDKESTEIKKELAELRAQLESQTKPKKKEAKKETKPKKKEAKKETKQKKKEAKKETKPKKKEAKKETKPKKKEAKKETKQKKKEAKKETKQKKKEAKKETKQKIPKTMEEEFEDQYTDEELRNFRIEKKDMEQLTNRVCEIVASYGDNGMLQNELWKKLKLSIRDGSRLSLRLERRGMITREKILQNGRWTYKLIIEQVPISLDSIQNAPCLTCPVEQKCNVDNIYPEPSPKHCELIEEWVIQEYKRKK